MVRRRRNEPHTRCAVARFGNPGVHLVARQLAAFAGLGTLRHFDLNVVGIHQIFTGYTKAARCHLFDCRTLRVAVGQHHVAFGVFAAFAGVALAADAVHGHGECFVGFGADRAITHRTGGKPFHDVAYRFHFVNRHGHRSRRERKQTAQCGEHFALVIHRRGVFFKQVVAPFAGGVLQAIHGFGVKQMVFAFATPLVFAAEF